MPRRRTLRRLLAGAPLAAVTIVALAVGAQPAAADDRCDAKRSKTEEASPHARVYSVRRIQDDAVTRRWYGCLYRSGRRVNLGDVGPAGMYSDRISPVRLAGHYVATATEYTASTGDALGAAIEVRDLRSGALVHRFQSPGEPNTYDVTDLELRSNGSVAWIARIVQGMPATTTYEVRRLPVTESHSTILDTGPGIERRSLALSGARLYWTHEGTPRSAMLR